jgi:hypothetical protein
MSVRLTRSSGHNRVYTSSARPYGGGVVEPSRWWPNLPSRSTDCVGFLFSTVMWNTPERFALTRRHLRDSTLGQYLLSRLRA